MAEIRTVCTSVFRDGGDAPPAQRLEQVWSTFILQLEKSREIGPPPGGRHTVPAWEPARERPASSGTRQ